jgi:hypothetical protein
MTDNHQSWPRRRLLRVGGFVLLGLLLLARIGYSQIQSKKGGTASTEIAAEPKHQPTEFVAKVSVQEIQLNVEGAILQGSIHVEPVQPLPEGQGGKIQPGTLVKIVVTVENNSQRASPAGELYVRYAFAHPLDKEQASIIFTTEKKPLPSIKDGEKIDIAFDMPHQIPSLLDFVRNDWSLREYQAFVVINAQEYLIGTLAITFSAHYYPGIKKEYPARITH